MERMKDNSIEASTSLLQSVFRLLCARKYYTEVLRIAETVQLPQDPVPEPRNPRASETTDGGRA